MPTHAISTRLAWEPGPFTPSLSSDQVHVWRFHLDDQASETCQRLRSWLSAEECTRADRFHRVRDRQRFLIGRGALRDLLGRYVGLLPQDLRFATGPFGKPRLEQPNDSAIQFNLSHSHGHGVIAVSKGRELGIDIEMMRPMENMDAIANRFFAVGEHSTYLAQPEALRPLAFFRVWTRKEAYLKATGTGISVPLDSFEVTVDPGDPPAIRHVADQPDEAARWSMREFWPQADALVSLAVEGQGWATYGYDYSPRDSC